MSQRAWSPKKNVHHSGKFKGMLICATNQDSNETLFIITHDLDPREV